MTCIFIVYRFINKVLKTKRKNEGKRKKSTEKEGKKRNYNIKYLYRPIYFTFAQ